jgi:hypothetical protein
MERLPASGIALPVQFYAPAGYDPNDLNHFLSNPRGMYYNNWGGALRLILVRRGRIFGQIMVVVRPNTSPSLRRSLIRFGRVRLFISQQGQQITIYNVSGGGAILNGIGVDVNLSGSKSGTTYRLKNGSTTIATKSGTGSALTFTNVTSIGTLTIEASLSGRTKMMSGFANTIVETVPIPTNDFDKNWAYSISYDGDENPIGESVSYFDLLGRPTQSQSKLYASGAATTVLATQKVYDAYGRPVLSTLAAPVNQTVFNYKDGFITNINGVDYSYTDFDKPITTHNYSGEAYNPRSVSNTTIGTLGWYYSDNNTMEPYVAASKFPYSRIEYSKLNLGAARKTTLAGEHFKLGSGHEAQSYSMLTTFNEIRGYTSIAAYPNLRTYTHIIKSIGVNQDGKISVSFSGMDKTLLASVKLSMI